MPRQRKHHLTVYLVREGIEFDEAIDTGTDLQSVALRHGATLFSRAARPAPPSWLSFFESRVNAKAIGALIASCAALLLVKHKGRVYGVAFGQGRHLFKDGVLEPGFGLRVVLNAVDPERIRTIDKDSLDVVGRRTREQVTREATIASFGLNVDQDLVRAVTGSATDQALGRRLTGADALVLSVPNSFTDLPDILERCGTLYRSKAYRKNFEWIDHIGPARDPATLARLDLKLATQIRHQEVQKIWLSVPEVLEWTLVSGFRYAGWRDKEVVDDIFMPDFLARYPDLADLTSERLKTAKVQCIGGETDRPMRAWRLYDCIYAEVEDKQTLHLLNGGEWYRVDRDFVAQVNRDVSRLMSPQIGGGFLPPYRDSSEGAYNERVCGADKARLALMDRKLIPYSGRHSSVEFCDIYAKTKSICHIKRYGGSSVLSHLFAQGVVSAEAFAHDSGFRAKVNAKLPAPFQLADPGAQIDPGDFTVVFGIVSRLDEALQLPFFSRVTLRNAWRRLSANRYKVAVVRIPIENA